MLTNLAVWISLLFLSGAPARRPFVSEAQVLNAINDDLRSAPNPDRASLRYYSLANLWNNPEIDDAELVVYRASLGKLINHLSWKREITTPRPLGPENLLLRIDLRDYGWSPETWRRITDSYPYALGRAPYIRVDWFVANASKPPLYHDILRLPRTLGDLEAMLHLDTAFDIQQNFARRFGVTTIGLVAQTRNLLLQPRQRGLEVQGASHGARSCETCGDRASPAGGAGSD